MSYAQIADVQSRMVRQMSTEEEAVCSTLLEDAAIMIDALSGTASADAKKLVSCRMVIRALGDPDSQNGIPVGASQGSASALGYSQSWTMSGGSTGELYISKVEKRLLRTGNSIGSYSPLEEYVPEVQE